MGSATARPKSQDRPVGPHLEPSGHHDHYGTRCGTASVDDGGPSRHGGYCLRSSGDHNPGGARRDNPSAHRGSCRAWRRHNGPCGSCPFPATSTDCPCMRGDRSVPHPRIYTSDSHHEASHGRDSDDRKGHSGD